MKFNFLSKVCAAAALLAFAAMPVYSDDFFKSSQPDPKLPADKLYPQGQKFPFSGYSPSSVYGFKKLGFTAAGPTYGKGKDKLALNAKKEGISNIWQLAAVYDGITLDSKDKLAKAAKAAGKGGIDWKKMDACVQKAVKDAIKASKNNISWWALAVEEVRWWNKNELKYLEVAYKAVKKADPEKRPMFVYMPGHYGSGGMRQYMPFMDLLAQGYYPNFGNRAGFRYWCENVQQTVKGFPGRFMVAVTEMYRDPKEEADYELIPAFVRHDVWMAIIHGFKGVIVFSFAQRRNFDSHGEFFFAYSEVAGELNRAENGLGKVVLFGQDKKDIQLKVVEGPATVSIKRKQKPAGEVEFTYPTIKWRDMIHNSGRYCFAASSSKEPVKAVLSGLPKQPVTVINAANGKVLGKTADGTFKLDFGPYGVQLLKFVAE